MPELPNIKEDFCVLKLTKKDVTGRSDVFYDFRECVSTHENMYGGIGQWIKRRVIPGISVGNRSAYIGYLDGTAVATAVAKSGKNAKICHVKIGDDLQDRHLGEVFFCLMALDLRNSAKEVHFTLPESLWEKEKEFFRSFGFADAAIADVQYRLFDTELRCSSDFENFWARVLQKLPKLSNAFSIAGHTVNNGLVLSIRPEYAKSILAGKKKIEVRRKFSEKWTGARVNLYSSSPESGLVGQATIVRVSKKDPEDAWEQYAEGICCDHEMYRSYTKGLDVCYFIELGEVKPFNNVVRLPYVSRLIQNQLRPPQSYCSLDRNQDWSSAVSIAALMNGLTEGSLLEVS